MIQKLHYLGIACNFLSTSFFYFPNQFFYLITETYKMGTLKEMQRWAYEIFSSFLVPDAPLRVHSLETSAIEEIDR